MQKFFENRIENEFNHSLCFLQNKENIFEWLRKFQKPTWDYFGKIRMVDRCKKIKMKKILALFCACAIIGACTKNPVRRHEAGRITEKHGWNSRAMPGTFVLRLSNGATVVASPDNPIWDFESQIGDSVRVAIHEDGSASAHTVRMERMMDK